jgi:antitoxin component YwqK of YwqJK toxin-antitoxin module
MNYLKNLFVLILILSSACSRENSKGKDNSSDAISSANKFKYEETYNCGGLKLFKSSNLPVTGFVQNFDDKKGFLNSETYYINGIENGISTSYYEDGKESRRENYLNGQLDGSSHKYYENGRKSFEGSYLNGKPDGQHVAWYEDGKLHYVKNYENGKLIGWQTEFNEDGTLLYEANLINGNGKITYTNPKAEIEINKNYLNGEIVFPENGIYLNNLSPKSNIIFEESYKNGQKISYKVYKKNKKLNIESKFKYDLLDGLHKRYYDSGKTEIEGNYVFGLENGIWQTWYENGTLKSLEKFDYGLSISKKCWDENGKEIECK